MKTSAWLQNTQSNVAFAQQFRRCWAFLWCVLLCGVVIGAGTACTPADWYGKPLDPEPTDAGLIEAKIRNTDILAASGLHGPDAEALTRVTEDFIKDARVVFDAPIFAEDEPVSDLGVATISGHWLDRPSHNSPSPNDVPAPNPPEEKTLYAFGVLYNTEESNLDHPESGYTNLLHIYMYDEFDLDTVYVVAAYTDILHAGEIISLDNINASLLMYNQFNELGLLSTTGSLILQTADLYAGGLASGTAVGNVTPIDFHTGRLFGDPADPRNHPAVPDDPQPPDDPVTPDDFCAQVQAHVVRMDRFTPTQWAWGHLGFAGPEAVVLVDEENDVYVLGVLPESVTLYPWLGDRFDEIPDEALPDLVDQFWPISEIDISSDTSIFLQNGERLRALQLVHRGSACTIPLENSILTVEKPQQNAAGDWELATHGHLAVESRHFVFDAALPMELSDP